MLRPLACRFPAHDARLGGCLDEGFAPGRPLDHQPAWVLATVAEESGAERRALYVVAATFSLLAAYIAVEAGSAVIGREELTAPGWAYS
jgi:hypothetical protein